MCTSLLCNIGSWVIKGYGQYLYTLLSKAHLCRIIYKYRGYPCMTLQHIYLCCIPACLLQPLLTGPDDSVVGCMPKLRHNYIIHKLCIVLWHAKMWLRIERVREIAIGWRKRKDKQKEGVQWEEGRRHANNYNWHATSRLLPSPLRPLPFSIYFLTSPNLSLLLQYNY